MQAISHLHRTDFDIIRELHPGKSNSAIVRDALNELFEALLCPVPDSLVPTNPATWDYPDKNDPDVFMIAVRPRDENEDRMWHALAAMHENKLGIALRRALLFYRDAIEDAFFREREGLPPWDG